MIKQNKKIIALYHFLNCTTRPRAPDVINFSHIKNKYPVPNNTQGTHRQYDTFLKLIYSYV